MHMVKGELQLDLLGQQHRVAENVAAHIAHTCNGEGLFLNILAHFAEVTLHGFPAALGGDTHFFVVVASRTAGGESIVQPETMRHGKAVGDIRECCRAFICGDD